MKQFDIFRINCWLDDLEDQKYESSISAITNEFLMALESHECLSNQIFDFIRNSLGIRINYEKFKKIIASDSNYSLESSDEDIYIKLNDEAIQKFRERTEKHSIENFIRVFCDEGEYKGFEEKIRNLLLNSLYININSFAISDLRSLISDEIKKSNNDPTEIEAFNSFLEWDNDEKNKSIYALFSKSIEFAILTSGRGISSIDKSIFTNKCYFLDTNIIIRALGVDGPQRQDSTISIIESCRHDGIEFKISKVTYDEIYKNLNGRTKDVEKKTNPQSEKLGLETIDDLPFNNSFETDYLHKRKEGKVSSPSKYRLNLEKEFQKLCDRFDIKTEPIKGIKQIDLTDLKKYLLKQKKERIGPWAYSIGAALVDAKNILYVRLIRGANNYNYKDIKSFYLTTDTTLNDIMVDMDKNIIAETILPSQLFVIHNSFHKKSDEEDYNDFIKYIKIRRTDFKLPGKEIFNYIEQVQESTTNKDDVVSTLKAYANHRFESRFKESNGSKKSIQTVKEFTKTHLQKELGEAKLQVRQLDAARVNAIKRLETIFKRSIYGSYLIEVVLLSTIAIVIHFLNKNLGTTAIVVIGVIVFRVILLFMKDKFGIHRAIRNSLFMLQVRADSFYKIHKEDEIYSNKIDEYKENAT